MFHPLLPSVGAEEFQLLVKTSLLHHTFGCSWIFDYSDIRSLRRYVFFSFGIRIFGFFFVCFLCVDLFTTSTHGLSNVSPAKPSPFRKVALWVAGLLLESMLPRVVKLQ